MTEIYLKAVLYDIGQEIESIRLKGSCGDTETSEDTMYLEGLTFGYNIIKGLLPLAKKEKNDNA